VEREILAQLSDDALMERYLEARAPIYFAEVFHRHRQRIFLCCCALLRNPESAADMTQETFLRGMRSAHTFVGGSLAAWLATIARNLCFNQIQALNRGPRSLDELEDPPADSVSLDVSLDLAARVAELPELQKLCIRLHYFNGLSYDEIARANGLTLEEVKAHMQNGRRRLRRSGIRQ
jgi:RNA polymerase sigma-70 factor, ECF subfamily